MLRGVARRCALAALRPTVGAPKAVCQGSSIRTYAVDAGKYSSTTEVPPCYEQDIKNTPQDPDKEEFVRYMASILHPMASEIVWDDQTNDVTINIYPQFIRPVLKMLRDHQQFQYKCLVDMTCVDTMSNVCHYLCIRRSRHNRVEFQRKIRSDSTAENSGKEVCKKKLCHRFDLLLEIKDMVIVL